MIEETIMNLMSEPIYFSKVEFRDDLGRGNLRNIILLDIVQNELSYQVIVWKEQMPAIRRLESHQINGKQYELEMDRPAKKIKSVKTEFNPVLMPDEQYNQKVAFSYGMKLSEIQMQQLLPYCNAVEFEPYRNKAMSLTDEGYIGYRDEISLHFTGITDSHIPKMEWDMKYYYDEKHIWPSEKLYRYLVLEYLQNNKKLKGHAPSYGSFSLFF